MTATTIQVRELMRKHHIIPQTAELYTNKRVALDDNARTVKCYARAVNDPMLLINELIKLAGKGNVKMTTSDSPGIVVKCVLG
jgi:hypothetical protein